MGVTGPRGLTGPSEMVDEVGPGVRDRPAQKTDEVLAKRWDAPVVRKSSRGSLAKALASGRPEAREETMSRYQRDKFTAAGHVARQALWNTWERLRVNWFGASLAVLPLTVDSIAAVLSQLKAGGYRSVGNYVSRAKFQRLQAFSVERSAGCGMHRRKTTRRTRRRPRASVSGVPHR